MTDDRSAASPTSPTPLGRDDIARLSDLRARLDEMRLADRARAMRELDRLYSRRSRGRDFESAVGALEKQIEASRATVARLRALPLRVEYDAALPITAHREEIIAAVAKHPVIVVCGATGSGKTTQLPKFCLEAGRGALGLIGHTQPRRIAARALANRLAFELQSSVGGAIGCQVRFSDRTGPDCRIKLMTDGILLNELEGDRELRRYDTLIIDEAHERTLNIDLLLGVLRGLTTRRPDLRVIVTSATIDPARFGRFFNDAPVIEVSGRSYPVEVRWRPLVAEDEDAAELSLPEGVVEAVRELDAPSGAGRSDVLVFLPGEKHIREAAEALRKARLPATEVLPLYARLSANDQQRIFAEHRERRIVLATNVAETSLTVPGIRSVVDSGLARIGRYSVRGKVQRLPIEPISQASADQRKGRCGREAPGICIRLYGEEDFSRREPFTPPEVLRTNLASVLLRMAVLNLGEPEQFPFLDPPDTRLVNDGVLLLRELRAMDEQRRVTSLGRELASLPLDPRLARMLLAAAHHRSLTEMLVIAAFLETQDPRERPQDAQAAADEKHALFADPRSDFVGALNLWRAFGEQAAISSGGQLRKWCREHFLSFVRMREWQDLHAQLSANVDELGLRINEMPASYSDLHQAILTGFLGSIGELDARREYVGARGVRFVIAPGTPVGSKPPRWLVAASLVETTRLYARMVAAVEPAWIEAAGEHLLKRSYAEPHWVASKGFVAAFESVSLYGLTLAARRRVNYGSIAPDEAIGLFVREAIVAGDSNLRSAFLDHNRGLQRDAERLEAKIRRRDIVVDTEAIAHWYLARIPATANSIPSFERWFAGARQRDPNVLRMSVEDLRRRAVSADELAGFPDDFEVAGNRLPLEYRFEPAAADDGVTLTLPEALLDALDAEELAWHVPGLRHEKVTAMLRSLPKAQRVQLVPIPDAARDALVELGTTVGGFHATLAGWVTRRVGAPVSAAELAALPLPEHLRMNVRIVATDGRVLAEGRDLVALRRRLRAGVSSASTAQVPRGRGADPHLHREWSFGDIADRLDVRRNGLQLVIFPAIEDRGGGVVLVEARTAEIADATSRAGIVRLALLALPQQSKHLRQVFTAQRELLLLAQGLELKQPLVEALLERSFRECFVPDDEPLPRTRGDFEARLTVRRAVLVERGEKLASLVATILREWRDARAAVAAVKNAADAAAHAETERQLNELISPDFLQSTPRQWLEQFPRYLKAIARRCAKIPGNSRRDAELAGKVRPFAAARREIEAQSASRTQGEAVATLRWMIEEFRVSLFAQDLRTVIPVSEKRLADQVAKARQHT